MAVHLLNMLLMLLHLLVVLLHNLLMDSLVVGRVGN